jgi:hypothetical protein
MVTFGNESSKNSLLPFMEPKRFRGAICLLDSIGHGVLTEFPLKNGRRADIISLSEKGEIWIVEVKSGFRTPDPIRRQGAPNLAAMPAASRSDQRGCSGAGAAG